MIVSTNSGMSRCV